MNDAFGLIQKYTGISRLSKSEVVTPKRAVSDMVDLLPADAFSPESKFLDPAVKSCSFLVELYNRLMASEYMKQTFPNEHDRREHILHNQLYGIAMSETAAIIARKQLYDDFTIVGNIIYTDGVLTEELVQGAFSNMKFDVVIGNPPYNDDIYLDFVKIGHKMADKYTVMITPAKWQAKGGDKNEYLRKHIVPYIEKVCFYPDARDIFDIKIQGGVCYYLIGKSLQDAIEISNACAKNKLLNSKQTRAFNGTLYNSAISVFEKLGQKRLNAVCTDTKKKYGVYIIGAFMNGAIMLERGNTLLLGAMSIQELSCPIVKASEVMIFSSDSKDECQSFISFVNSKFIRFIAFTLVEGQSPKFEKLWKFVPDPGKFDHIFTDDELYKTYGLTPEEINIIESVIKERKLC